MTKPPNPQQSNHKNKSDHPPRRSRRQKGTNHVEHQQERAEAEARAAREEAERREQEVREKSELNAFFEKLRKPGRVKDGARAVKAADALGVKVPLRTRGFMLEKLAAFIVEDDGHVERIQYYRNGGRAYNGSGVYQTLTEICKAAREYAQRCECGQVSC